MPNKKKNMSKQKRKQSDKNVDQERHPEEEVVYGKTAVNKEPDKQRTIFSKKKA